MLQGECRSSFVKKEMRRVFSEKYDADIYPFVGEVKHLDEAVFKYEPPFGFQKFSDRLQKLLELLPEHEFLANLKLKHCKRCVVIGSGGLLHGVGLGHTLDQFDVVIRYIFLLYMLLYLLLTSGFPLLWGRNLKPHLLCKSLFEAANIEMTLGFPVFCIW